MLPNIIQYYHLIFCHASITKTKQVIKFSFYIRTLERHKVRQLATCVHCKYNKVSNKNVRTEVCQIVVFKLGEIIAVDIYGTFLHV